MKKAQQKIDSILTRWRDSGRAPTYTELTEVAAQLAQALTDAPKQPVIAPTLKPSGKASRMTELKTKSILDDGAYQITGYVLSNEDGKRAVVELGAVRWIEKDSMWNLMHGPDKQPVIAPDLLPRSDFDSCAADRNKLKDFVVHLYELMGEHGWSDDHPVRHLIRSRLNLHDTHIFPAVGPATPQPVIAPAQAQPVAQGYLGHVVLRSAFRASPDGQDADGREWLEFTDDETEKGAFAAYATPQPVIAPEPARAEGAIATVTDNFRTDFSEISRTFEAPIPIGTKLYTRPQPAVAPTQPISDFDAANAFMSEAHTDDVFAAYQQGVRLAERRHGITAPKEQHDPRL